LYFTIYAILVSVRKIEISLNTFLFMKIQVLVAVGFDVLNSRIMNKRLRMECLQVGCTGMVVDAYPLLSKDDPCRKNGTEDSIGKRHAVFLPTVQ